MKIETPKKPKEYKLFTLKLRRDVCDALDALGGRAGLSRQKLIEAILGQVVSDPKFVLRARD